MLSLATEADRTLFFDFLPIELGTIRGMKTRVQLYTVPGQVFYNATRRMVLKGADCVVFVADSQDAMMEANTDAMKNLRENLIANELDADNIPLVIQYNKRDLPNAAPIADLNRVLNTRGVPFVEASAKNGQGVEETLKVATQLVFRVLASKYGNEGMTTTSGGRTTGGLHRPAFAARAHAASPASPPRRRLPPPLCRRPLGSPRPLRPFCLPRPSRSPRPRIRRNSRQRTIFSTPWEARRARPPGSRSTANWASGPRPIRWISATHWKRFRRPPPNLHRTSTRSDPISPSIPRRRVRAQAFGRGRRRASSTLDLGPPPVVAGPGDPFGSPLDSAFSPAPSSSEPAPLGDPFGSSPEASPSDSPEPGPLATSSAPPPDSMTELGALGSSSSFTSDPVNVEASVDIDAQFAQGGSRACQRADRTRSVGWRTQHPDPDPLAVEDPNPLVLGRLAEFPCSSPGAAALIPCSRSRFPRS